MEQMIAGRELDALIAEKVMGWVNCGLEYNEMRGSPPEWARLGHTDRSLPVPTYSTDIAAAWTVYQSRFLTAQIIGYTVHDPSQRPDLTEINALGYAVEYFCTADGVPIVAPTAPLAICRAALVTLEPAQ